MFENNQNNYRRSRDYSIVATILLYGLTIIDAYVDAQLFDFDISPDLSMNVEPDLYYDKLRNTRTPEVHLAITFWNIYTWLYYSFLPFLFTPNP